MIKIFMDAEFTGLHKLTTLISLALVCEDGREYYAELTDFDEHQITPFLEKEILSKLIIKDFDIYRDYNPEATTVSVKGDMDMIKQTLIDWFHPYSTEEVEIWVESPTYAWTLFVDIFGGVHLMPKHIYRLPLDLFTAYKLFGLDPTADKSTFLENHQELVTYGKNNALNDARINKHVYKKLLDIKVKPLIDGEEEVEIVEETKEENEIQQESKESI